MEVGGYDEAESLFTEALQLANRLGTIPWIRNAQQNLGVIALARRKYDQAMSHLKDSADGYLTLELPTCAAVSIFGMARAQVELGCPSMSAELAARAVELGAADPAALGPALAVLAQVELARGNVSAALAAATRAMQVLEETPFFEYVAFVHLAHIDALLACGMREAAAGAIADARRWLLQRAARIESEALRRAFLTGIAEHDRILVLAGESLARVS